MFTENWHPRNGRLMPAFEAWRRGDHVAAERAFAVAVRVNRDDPDAWRGLGSVQWSQRRFGACLQSFLTALTLDASNPVGWCDVGLANRELRRWANAIHDFQVARTLDPEHAPAYNEWANVLVDTGDYRTAQLLYEQALRLAPGRPVYHHNLGVCMRMQGDNPTAITCFERALLLDPEYGWSRIELSQMLSDRLEVSDSAIRLAFPTPQSHSPRPTRSYAAASTKPSKSASS